MNFFIIGQQFQKFPCQLFFFRMVADSHQKRIDHGGIAPLRSCRQCDAVPLKLCILLDFIGISLIGSVFGKGQRHKRHISTVKIVLRHLLPLIQICNLLGKAHRLRHTFIVEITLRSVFVKKFRPIGINGFRPSIIVSAELIQQAVPVPVFGDLSADLIQIVPGPVIVRYGQPFPVQQRLVDKHQRRHRFIGQRILPSVILPCLQSRVVIALFLKIRICHHKRLQIFHNTDFCKLIKIFSQHHKHIRFFPPKDLPGKPLGIIFFADTAVIMYYYIVMLRLKLFHSLVYDHITVGIGHIPVAACENAHFQHHHPGFLPDQAACQQSQRTDQACRYADFLFSAHICSGFLLLTPVCTAQMASCVRSRSPSLFNIVLK